MKNPRFTVYNDYPYDFIAGRALEKGIITKSDHDLIIDYIVSKKSKGEIEDARAQRISTGLTQWRRFIESPYNEMTYKTLLNGVAKIRTGKTANGKPYEPGTIRQQIKIIKTFTKYLMKNKIVNITRDELDEIKYPKEVFDSVKSKDILTPEQIEMLIGAAGSIRDKAIIGLLTDTGLRPSDVAGLTWHDLEFNQQRVKVSVTTEKTNTTVSAYVILHKSWLVELRKHCNAATDDDFVFVDAFTSEPITYNAINHLLDRASEKSGVKFPKRARAKLFRATSITNQQKAGFSSAAISKMHFGVPDSKMMRHYSKLCDEDTERESLERSGAVMSEKPQTLRPMACPECGEPCAPGVKFCPECGKPLTEEAALNRHNAESDIDNDPRFKAWLAKARSEFQEMLGTKEQ